MNSFEKLQEKMIEVEKECEHINVLIGLVLQTVIRRHYQYWQQVLLLLKLLCISWRYSIKQEKKKA